MKDDKTSGLTTKPTNFVDSIDTTLERINELLATGMSANALPLALKLRTEIETSPERDALFNRLISLNQTIKKIQEIGTVKKNAAIMEIEDKRIQVTQRAGWLMMILGVGFLFFPVPWFVPVLSFGLALYWLRNFTLSNR